MIMADVSYSLCGGILGLLPAALLVLADRSAGHGGETFALLALVLLGIPGMSIGSSVGRIIRRGAKGGGVIPIALGNVLGAFLGFFGGLLLQESVRSSISLREQDAACLGLLGGGIVGILLGGWMGGRSRKEK